MTPFKFESYYDNQNGKTSIDVIDIDTLRVVYTTPAYYDVNIAWKEAEQWARRRMNDAAACCGE